jgi:hypothetical protein
VVAPTDRPRDPAISETVPDARVAVLENVRDARVAVLETVRTDPVAEVASIGQTDRRHSPVISEIDLAVPDDPVAEKVIAPAGLVRETDRIDLEVPVTATDRTDPEVPVTATDRTDRVNAPTGLVAAIGPIGRTDRAADGGTTTTSTIDPVGQIAQEPAVFMIVGRVLDAPVGTGVIGSTGIPTATTGGTAGATMSGSITTTSASTTTASTAIGGVVIITA